MSKYNSFALISSPSALAVQHTRRQFKVKTRLIHQNDADWYFPGSLSDNELQYITRIRLFCEANSLPFTARLSGIFPEALSRFLTRYNSRDFRMITYAFILKQSADIWYEIGEYRANLNNKNSPYADYSSYVRVSIPTNFAPMIINSRTIGNRSVEHKGLIAYETESNEFNRNFELYIDSSRIHDSLTLLSPDVMAELIDFYGDFDIEINSGRIFIMTKRINFFEPEVFDNFIKHIEYLINLLSYQIRSEFDSSMVEMIQPNLPAETKLSSNNALRDLLFALAVTTSLLAVVFLYIYIQVDI